LRTSVPIKVSGADYRPAKGKNPNPLMSFTEVQDPGKPGIIDDKGDVDYFDIDFNTGKGKSYVVTSR